MNYYDEIAGGYDELYEEEQMKKLNLIASKIQIGKQKDLLDIGCGSGISTRFFECERTGIDPSVEMIKIARQRDPQGNYVVADAEKIPFKDGSFDFVISITAVHNFRDVEKGLDEVKRVAKKADRNIVITVLRKSRRFEEIEKCLLKRFRLREVVLDTKDAIFFLERKDI